MKKVYCLVRPSAQFSPLERLIASRKLLHSAADEKPTESEAEQLFTILAYNSKLARESLGLVEKDYTQLLNIVTEDVHCVWVMNYDM